MVFLHHLWAFAKEIDPLSQCLFIIMEVLTRELQKAQNKKKCEIGFRMAPIGNKIPYLLIASNNLRFRRTNVDSSQQLNNLQNKNFAKTQANIIIFISYL